MPAPSIDRHDALAARNGHSLSPAEEAELERLLSFSREAIFTLPKGTELSDEQGRIVARTWSLLKKKNENGSLGGYAGALPVSYPGLMALAAKFAAETPAVLPAVGAVAADSAAKMSTVLAPAPEVSGPLSDTERAELAYLLNVSSATFASGSAPRAFTRDQCAFVVRVCHLLGRSGDPAAVARYIEKLPCDPAHVGSWMEKAGVTAAASIVSVDGHGDVSGLAGLNVNPEPSVASPARSAFTGGVRPVRPASASVRSVPSPRSRAPSSAERGRLPHQDVIRQAGVVIEGDPAMEEAWNLVARYAEGDMAVLIRGETGAGKEMFPGMIHEIRRTIPGIKDLKGSLVAANFAAFAEGTVASELFGHKKGSFTGAVSDHPGLFEQAGAGGTVFLDEIADMPLHQQAMLLRVMDGKKVKPVGAKESEAIHLPRLKIVAATNKNLEKLVRIGKFREDLYYRLKGSSVSLPPLRERAFPHWKLLVEGFVASCGDMLHRTIEIDPEAVEAFSRLPFPGNVRELRDHVERACVMAHDGSVVTRVEARHVESTRQDAGRVRDQDEAMLLDFAKTERFLNGILEMDVPRNAHVADAVLQFRLRYADLRADDVSLDTAITSLQALIVTHLVNEYHGGNQSAASAHTGRTRGSIRHFLRYLEHNAMRHDGDAGREGEGA